MAQINISIDDVSPHPLSSTKVLDQCYRLIESFEQIKFTLFIPVAYWRTRPSSNNVNTQTSRSLDLNIFSEFCDTIDSLPEQNFEIGYHGFYHGIPGISNNDEFKSLNYEEADKKFKLMYEVVELAGLAHKFSPIFRPPAWRMSAASILAAKDNGIEILALSPEPYAQETYGEATADFDKIVYYNVNPPFKPLQRFPKTEIVYHACEWDKNYLDKEKTDNLLIFLKEEEDEFVFMKDL